MSVTFVMMVIILAIVRMIVRVSNMKATCSYCENRYTEDEMNYINYDEFIWICNICLDEHFNQCNDCREWYLSEKTIIGCPYCEEFETFQLKHFAYM